MLKKKLTDKEKLAVCPVMVINGWWWKKYFKYFRKRNEIFNEVYQMLWLDGGYETYQEMCDNMFNMMLDQLYIQEFPPVIGFIKNNEKK